MIKTMLHPARRRIRSGLFRVVVSILVAAIMAGCSKGCDECQHFCEEFLAKIQAGETGAAFEHLGSRMQTTIGSERRNALVNTTNIQIKRFGPPDGYELISEEPLGSRISSLSFLLYQPGRVSRWKFQFYRSEREWQLANFSVSDEVVHFR